MEKLSASGAPIRAYKPFKAALHGSDIPPAVNGTGNVIPIPETNSVGLQNDDAGQEKKKSKYGKYGNTMAHSAAGGVGVFCVCFIRDSLLKSPSGFGAGSAIGGGLVRAIF